MENQTTNKFASTASFIGAALFALLIVLFNVAPQNVALISIIGVTFHLLLFPVVSALPSPGWSKAAGYGWLVVDTACNVMSLNGVEEHITTPLRLGSHLSLALWIITTSLKCNRSMQVVGILQGILVGSYSLIAPWVPMWVLYPAMMLLIIWLVLAGMFLAKR